MIIKEINAQMLKDMIISGNNNLQNHKDLVDKLNVFPVPDGDTGTNMSLTMASAIKELRLADNLTIEKISKLISKGSLMGARGNSGVILSQIIRGFSKYIEDKESLNVLDVANALQNGAKTAYKAVIKPVEGTILTVVRESSDYAVEIAKNESNVISFLEKVILKANESLIKTPDLLPSLKEANVVDSGGKGLVLIYEGMLNALNNKFVEIKQQSEKSYEELTADTMPMNIEDIKFAYCTEFILETNKIDDMQIRDLMLPLGDSLAVVGDDGIIKVHVHTNEPNKALGIALKYGSLLTIKIENMKAQFLENQNKESIEEVRPSKKYGLISTSMGDGFSKIFNDFGVDSIIKGGQTMNPSTQDFLDAIDKINAENIIILPNNSNIIMSANQAKELSDKNIIVIPTKTIPQGITALINFAEDNSPDSNEEAMTEAINLVKTGQITYAVRDTVMNDIEVKAGNYIGISQGTITCSGKLLSEIVLNTVEGLISDDTSIISLYYGEHITKTDAVKIQHNLEDKFPDIDVELFEGGQPVYYYIISVE